MRSARRLVARRIKATRPRDGSFQMFAAVPSGRRVWVIWRYDREEDQAPDVFSELRDLSIFVITAY